MIKTQTSNAERRTLNIERVQGRNICETVEVSLPAKLVEVRPPNCLRSSRLKALEGRTIIAQGKRVCERRPGYAGPTPLPLTAKPRYSANLSCGNSFGHGDRRRRFMGPNEFALSPRRGRIIFRRFDGLNDSGPWLTMPRINWSGLTSAATIQNSKGGIQ